MNSLQTALVFLIQLLFDFYILLLLLRVILQYQHANYFNPICQFIIKITDPVVSPLQRFIPGFKGIDLAIVTVIFILAIIESIFIVWLQVGQFPAILGLLLFALGRLMMQVINLYLYAIIINVILSWLGSPKTIALREVAALVSEPLLAPARRYIPPISGIDLSPVAVIVVLQLLVILIINPLMNTGFVMTFR